MENSIAFQNDDTLICGKHYNNGEFSISTLEFFSSAWETVAIAVTSCDVKQTHIYLNLWGELMLFNLKI